MADEKTKNQQNYNEKLKETVDYNKANLDYSYSLVESLKETLGIRTKLSEIEKDTYNLSKDITQQLKKTTDQFTSANQLNREIVKTQKLISNSFKIEESLSKSIQKERKNGADQTLQAYNTLRQEVAVFDSYIDLIQKGEEISEDQFQNQKDKLELAEVEAEILFEGLSNLEQQYVLNQLNTKEAEKLALQYKKVSERLGFASEIVDVLGAIPGLGGLASSIFQEIKEDALSAGDGFNGTIAIFTKLISRLTQVRVIMAGLAALTVKSFFQLNAEQTEFRRLTGESAIGIGLANDGLITSIDLIKTQIEFTKQLGLNTKEVFSAETLQAATEFSKLMGLSTDATLNLSKFSKITNQNMTASADALIASVPSAFSQQQILEKTANVSNDIAVSLGSSVTEIGKAVLEANKLGLSLGQVNDIAGSLLDIESSIASEFEAEVITGQQLNLERARFFALTNDLVGLTKEIGNNEQVINSFANANRIEQEAIAGALGMSRQQMADMVMQSDLLSTLSDEQRENATGLTSEQFKQLTVTEGISDSINKITQALAGPLEIFASLVAFASKFTAQIAAGLAALGVYKVTLGAIAAKQAFVTALKGRELTMESALAAIRTLGNPLMLVPALAAGAAVFAAARKYQNMGDGIFEAGKGPIISTREGGLFQGTANDDILVGPGIARGGRNAGLSQADVAAIAKAVRDGASQAQINLDGGRVSNRLQPSLAVNTRKYSI